MALFKADDPDVFAIRHDVLDRDGWERTADAIDKRYGKTHLLVNNAGVGPQRARHHGHDERLGMGSGRQFLGPGEWRAHLPAALPGTQRGRAHRHRVLDQRHVRRIGQWRVHGQQVRHLRPDGRAARRAARDQYRHLGDLFPGFTATNIGRAESYRPERYRNPEPQPLLRGQRRPPARARCSSRVHRWMPWNARAAWSTASSTTTCSSSRTRNGKPARRRAWTPSSLRSSTGRCPQRACRRIPTARRSTFARSQHRRKTAKRNIKTV